MDKPFLSFTPFVPRKGLSNPHLQTLAGNFLPRGNHLPPSQERFVRVDDAVQIVCHCHWQPEPSKKITIVIVHGLEGSSSSQYVIGNGNKAWAAGMNVVRMNMRNCGGTDQYANSLYHSGLSGDVYSVVQDLVEVDHLERIALLGYSMGGNLVLKLAGELGIEAPRELCAVVAVSPATDLAISADALHERQNRLYEANFLLGLKQRFKRKVKMFPENFQLLDMSRMRTLRDFDHQVTARYSGFHSADDYYERSSSSRVLQNINIPTLIIHSTDDPFIRMSIETRQKLTSNQAIRYMETKHGGHCAFLADPKGYDGRWAEQTAIAFLLEMACP